MNKTIAIRYSLIGVIVLLFSIQTSFSQNIVPAASYCRLDTPVSFFIAAPGDKTWTCDVAGVIVNNDNGNATFTPTAVPGPYPRVITILYQNPNYTGLPAAAYNPASAFFTYSVTITDPPVVTFAAIADVCQNTPSFALAPRGNPLGGVYAGTGVDIGGNFNPSVAGLGTHSLSYTYPATGCNATAYQMVTVNAIPAVTLMDFTPVCQGSAAFILTQGSPAGGAYSGTGVSFGVFDPAMAGVGTHTITYTVISGTCSASTSKTITVNALPTVNFNGLDNIVPATPWYCDNAAIDNLVGSPLGGSFAGAGIANVAPAGNATFDPKTSGLGEHDITYTYTDINGCISSKTLKTRVGTMIYINGLNAQYCKDAAVDNFSYTPFAAFPTSTVFGNGVTDLFSGNASFNPATAAIGNNVITYQYTDISGCVNQITQNVAVDIVPLADFSGLNATLKYCLGAGDVLLTGNYAPGGTFTGPLGSIVDNGNGTATFKPSVLTVGTYNIIYSYTNATGCNDTETKSVEILSLPTAFNVTGGGTFCETGAGVAIGLANSTTGVDYQLYRDAIAVAPPSIQPGNTGLPITFGLQNVAGTYTVISTSTATSCSQQMLGSASIIITPQAAITTQPVNATVCEEGSTSYTIQVSGTGLHYQWVKNGVNVGIDNNVLVLNAITLAENGHIIYCNVTSSCGGPLKSNDVTLTVNPKTVINTNPTDAVRCTGGGVSFSVVATGVNKTYQWKIGAANVVDLAGKISGSTTSILSILNLTTADEGLYSCIVTGDCGPAVQSTQAQLSVNDPIVITTQPVSKTACIGDNTSFSVVATGTTLSYQWQKNNINILGATNPSLSINVVVAGDAATYKCIISSPCGAILQTNNVIFSVPATTAITVIPTGGSICETTNFNFSVTATGNLLQYVWYKDGVALVDGVVVSNSNTANLSLIGVPQAYQGNYTVKVTGTCGVQTSNPPATLSVKKAIIFTTQPVNQTICSGSDVPFSVVVTGDVLAYQWQRNIGLGYVNIVGATSANYILTGALAADAGNYRCMITTTSCGTFYSTDGILTINPLTSITTQPVAAKNGCVGSNVSFSVAATGVGLTYQWYKNGLTMGVGYTNSTLNLTNIAAADAGSYTCYVSGLCEPTVISLPGVLTVSESIVISNQPIGQSVCSGSNYSLSVTTSAGNNLTYQWYFDNGGGFIAVAGGTTQALNIVGFAAANAGDYYVTITNGCGTITSNTARLTLVNSFSITTQPSSLSVCENGTATFTVVANQPGLSYQWRKNGVNIVGASSSTLVIINVPLVDNGSNYDCQISNSCGVLVSNLVQLTVVNPITIVLQPSSGVACLGQPFSVTIQATSSQTPSYKWQFDNGGGFSDIVGAINPSYSIASFAAGNIGSYRCVVSNTCQSITSASAVITAGDPIAITNPIPQSLCVGSDAIFTITTTGTNPTYEWRKNNIPVVDNGRITGSNTNSLSINNIIASDEGTYNIVVTGSCGLVQTSTGAFLDVLIPPTVTVAPVPQTICSGQNVSFSVTVTGELPITYAWQKDGVPINPLVNTTADESTLTISAATAVNAGIYRCIVTNSCGSISSTSAELIVEPILTISSQPVSITRCEGATATFSVGVTGPSNMVLKWYKDGVPLVENARIAGVSLSTLSINNITSTDAGNYWCEITSMCGNISSNVGILTVENRISITQQPISTTVCPNATLNLNVIATGTITGYQWRRNGVIIAGATNSSYTVSPFVAASHAGNYICDLTNICETVTSDIASVTAGVTTTATISGNLTACEGQNVNFTVTATGSNLSYKWYLGATLLADNARIAGSQTATLNITGLLPSDAGTYQCEVTGTCGIDNDNTAILTVQSNVGFSIEPTPTSALVGTNPTFTVVTSGNVTGIRWIKNGADIFDGVDYSGTTTPTLTILAVADPADEGDYSCRVTGPCGSITSSSATLTVLTSSSITVQPATPVTLCPGATLSLSVTTSGAGHSYQWKKDNVNLVDGGGVSGVLTSVLTINNVTTANTGAYTCAITDLSETSSASVVTVNPSTLIITDPLGGTKCQGDTHTFSVTATGNALTYQWYKDGLIIGGATSSSYTLTPLAPANNGTYHCIVTGTCGSKTSGTATLTVNPNTSIAAQPAPSTTICQDASTSLFFNVSGSGLTYLWKKNGAAISDANITGITSNTLLISNGVVSNFGNFTCTVTSACGGLITSNVATITVNPTTAITTQPISSTKCEGDGVIFTVNATGTSLVYDWRRNGVSLGLPSSSTLTISPLVKTTHEGTYTCLVTGTCGSLVSDPAILTVNRNVAITTHPTASTTICENTSTTLTVTATGDGLTYLWKKNGSVIIAANISGNTTYQLAISNIQLADAGVYTCTVSGSCGSSLTTNNAVIIVNPTTTITTQPPNFTKCSGDQVQFIVAATGNAMTYQWMKGGPTGTPIANGAQPSGAIVSGAATSQLTITGITATEAGSYTCVITGTCGNVNTTPAQLTVNELIQITTQPANLTTICQGSSTQITVVVSGTVLTYKWKKNGSYISDGGNISGTLTDKLMISNTSATDAGFYSCDISSTCNTVNTQSAEVRINPSTSITQHPIGATVCEGDNVQFTVTAVGAAPLTYQWRLNNVNIPLATSSTLTINGITPANAGAYTCVVTGSSTCGVATSNPANLVVNPKITIGTQPTDLTICEDNTAIFSLIASGTAPLTYKWKLNNINLTDNGRITGSTTNELRVNLSTNADEGVYKCEISSTCGLLVSNSVILNVTDSTKITAHPTSQTLLQGLTATFNVSAIGGLTYQWQKNNVNIGGATSNSYSIIGVLPTDVGSYKCIVTGTCGVVSTNIAVLTVNQLVAITTQPTALVKCVNDNASFTVAATGTIVSYQWKFNGANIVDGAGISGATTPNLVIASVATTNGGSYSCAITGSNNTANSNSVQLAVNLLVNIIQQPQTQTKCNGDILILEVTPNEPTYTYVWEHNGVPLVNGGRISGTNTSKLVITSVTSADAGTYRCTVSNTCGTQTSNPAIVTINPVVSITTEPSNLNQCEGQTGFFSVTANISTVNYQWYKNGIAMTNGGTISGTNTANLVITNLASSDAGNYSCRVYDNCTNDNSVVAQLIVKNKTLIQKQPVNMTVCTGSVAFFEVDATPTGLTYRWQKDGVDLSDIVGKIDGATTSVLVITNAALADIGVYRCLITGGCNNEITNPSNLTVNFYPDAAGAVTGIQTVCQGDINVLYVVPIITNATTYVWDVPYGATIVGGISTRSIQVTYTNSSLSGVVTVFGQNSCGNGASSVPLAITVNPRPTAIANIDQIICGTSTTLNANPVAGTWSILSGDAIIANPNLFGTSVTNIKKGVNEFIWTVTQIGCTARDTVKITNAYVDINAGPDQTICSTTAYLQALTPTTGATWTVVAGSGIIANTSSPATTVTLLAQDVNKFAWQINNLGCVSRDTVTINNHEPFHPNAGINQIVDVDFTTLDANIPETGTTGFWSIISGSGTFVNINDPKTQVNGLISGINTLVWSVSRNSCTLTDTMTIDNIMIVVPDAGLTQTLCTNETYLDASYPTIGIGEWSVISGAATFVNKYNNTTKITNIGHGSNWLRWTVRTSGLGMEYDDVLIVNNETSPANAGPDRVICTDATNLMANTPIYGNGTWTLNSGSGNITNINDPSSLISSLGQGKNDLKWTITNLSCISEDFVSITNNTPTTPDAGPDQTICFESVQLLPNTPSVGVGSWSLVSGSAAFNGSVATNLAPDLNVLRYTITKGTCSLSDDIIITNNKPTTPSAGYDQSICVNTFILNANPATQGTGTWTITSGSGTFSDTHLNNATVTGIANGINIFRWTIAKNGCTLQDEVMVSNDYVLAAAGSDVELCKDNTPLYASNPSPGTGFWSVVGSSGAIFDSQYNPNTTVRSLSKGINTLRWTVRNGSCETTDDVIISNYEPTTAFAGENQAVCGKDANLMANTANYGTGIWTIMSGTGTFGNANLPITTVSNLGVGGNVLRWTITKNICVSYSDVTITSNLPVNVFAGNNQNACADTTVLYANIPTIGTGTWSIISGSGAFDNPTNYNTTIRNLGKGQNILKWVVSSSDCHVADTVIITSSIPTPSIAGADQILCSETTVLGGNQPIVGSGRWSIVSGSVQLANPTLPNSSISNVARGISILKWIINENGCESSDDIKIINNLPSIPYAGYDQSICGDSTRLFADPPSIGTGVWSLVSGDASILNNQLNQTRVVNIKFGDNTFRWKVANRNCSLSDDVIIKSNYAYANAGTDRNVNTSTIQLIGNVPASGTGMWSLSAGQADIQNPNQFDTWVNNLGSGANIFTWSINNNGCIVSDEITINYIVMPVPDFNPSVTEGCSPLTVNFVNTSIGGTPYFWDLGDGTTSNETNIVHTYNLPGTYKVILTATASIGQTVKKEGTINVYGHPKAIFDIAPKIIYIPGQHISCFNYSINAVTSIWDFGDGQTKTELAPTYSYTDTGKFDITLKVLNSRNCEDSSTLEGIIHVKKLSGFFFPEAFTPNPTGGSNGAYNIQDRSNDVFYPIIIDGGITDYELKVYNRSGILVFKTNNVDVGWDGYYRNKLLPQDVYIYMINGRYNSGEKFQKVDNILLIRKDK